MAVIIPSVIIFLPFKLNNLYSKNLFTSLLLSFWTLSLDIVRCILYPSFSIFYLFAKYLFLIVILPFQSLTFSLSTFSYLLSFLFQSFTFATYFLNYL